MSTEPNVPEHAPEAPSPERVRALRSLAALDLGDLEIQGLVCDPDDPDCVVDGASVVDGVSQGVALPPAPAPEGATRSE
jgi:hypothetical protein